jgi:quinol monooxygenase YgiN
MDTSRKRILAAAFATALLAADSAAFAEAPMYGLIGSLTAQPGRGGDLIAVLPKGCARMAGCLSYIVARDALKPDVVWITEVWKDKASHDASLKSPVVQAAITRGRPLIAAFGTQTATLPVAGVKPGG